MKWRWLLIGLLLPASAHADIIPHWQVKPGSSYIHWTANYSGKTIHGDFPVFTSSITFDPAQLEKSAVEVTLQTGAVKSDDPDALSNLPDNDWFASSQYPEAVFKCDHFRHLAANRYVADGRLTLRGRTLPLVLPFTLKLDGHKAVMESAVSLKRNAFGVGQGAWANTATVADDVQVNIRLEASY